MSNSMENCPVEAELFLAARRKHRRTEVRNVITAFRNFANAPRKIISDCQKSIQNTVTVYTLWLDVDF